MKRIALAALAMITLLGLTGCDLFGAKTEDKPTTPAVTYSDTWWIKGSFDGWKDSGADKHWLVKTDATHYTYTITDLFNAVDYEFVLVNGATEVKNAGTEKVPTDETPITLGGANSVNNVKFTALKKSYLLSVDITTPAAPVIKLLGGADAANPQTNALLASKLQLAGANIQGITWSGTAGTYDAATSSVSWDVSLTDKAPEFGFPSLDGWVKGPVIDIAALAAVGDSVGPFDLVTQDPNTKLTNPGKADTVYTFTVALDATKTLVQGKYTLTIKVKTAGTTDWPAVAPWQTVVMNGRWVAADDGWQAGVAATNNAGVWTVNLLAGRTDIEFKPGKTGWDDSTNNIVQGAGSLALTGIGSGNLGFTAVVGNTYAVKIEFIGTYAADGKPTVTVTDLGVLP